MVLKKYLDVIEKKAIINLFCNAFQDYDDTFFKAKVNPYSFEDYTEDGDNLSRLWLWMLEIRHMCQHPEEIIMQIHTGASSEIK